VDAAIDSAARQLAKAGSTSARLDAQLLLARVVGADRVAVLAHPERELSAQQLEAFEQLVRRRERAEPMAYLLGEREFYGRVFRSDSRALIPRPETELLVSMGLEAVERWRARGLEPTVVDVGTGAGAIALSVAAECRVSIVATEISWQALTLARENAALLGIGRVNFVQSDLLAGLRGRLHIVLANLPYVPTARELPSDVRDYEPHVAIFGGARGIETIERLLREAAPLLAPGGEVCVELDEEEQAEAVSAVAQRLYAGAHISTHQDNGGYDRVVRVHTPYLSASSESA
jgi:release factor glutamine methyltransferase